MVRQIFINILICDAEDMYLSNIICKSFLQNKRRDANDFNRLSKTTVSLLDN